MIGPVSTPSSTKCTVTPMTFTPCSTASLDRPHARERGQQRRVHVDDGLGKRAQERRRQQLHVAGEHDELDAALRRASRRSRRRGRSGPGTASSGKRAVDAALARARSSARAPGCVGARPRRSRPRSRGGRSRAAPGGWSPCPRRGRRRASGSPRTPPRKLRERARRSSAAAGGDAARRRARARRPRDRWAKAAVVGQPVVGVVADDARAPAAKDLDGRGVRPTGRAPLDDLDRSRRRGRHRARLALARRRRLAADDEARIPDGRRRRSTGTSWASGRGARRSPKWRRIVLAPAGVALDERPHGAELPPARRAAPSRRGRARRTAPATVLERCDQAATERVGSTPALAAEMPASARWRTPRLDTIGCSSSRSSRTASRS